MTGCAILASSAKADPRVINIVNLDHTNSHPGLIRPYNVVPVNQVSFNNAFGYDLTQPLSSYSMPTYGLAAFPTHHFIIERPSWNPPTSSRAKWTTQLMVLNRRFRSRLIVWARASPSSMWSKRISMILCGTTTSWSTGGWLRGQSSPRCTWQPQGEWA